MKSKVIVILCGITLLAGCATSQFVGYGRVVREMKVSKVDYTPKPSTDTGALIGGGVGAAGGFLFGTILTVATLGLAVATIPMFTMAGGAGGAALGGGTGYIYGVAKQGNGLFTYIVSPLHAKGNKHNILVRQFQHEPFKVGQLVRIMRKKGTYYLLHM